VTEWDARLREGCWGEGRGGEEGERDVGRAAAEWREGPGIDGSGIWSESIVVGRKKALFDLSDPLSLAKPLSHVSYSSHVSNSTYTQ
jgi:hypothetical protein